MASGPASLPTSASKRSSYAGAASSRHEFILNVHPHSSAGLLRMAEVVSSPFIGFYRVLPGFTGLSVVGPGFTGFYWVLWGFTGFYKFLLGFTEFHSVLLGFTVFL